MTASGYDFTPAVPFQDVVDRGRGYFISNSSLIDFFYWYDLSLMSFFNKWLEYLHFLFKGEIPSIGLIMVLDHEQEAVLNILRNDSAHGVFAISRVCTDFRPCLAVCTKTKNLESSLYSFVLVLFGAYLILCYLSSPRESIAQYLFISNLIMK